MELPDEAKKQPKTNHPDPNRPNWRNYLGRLPPHPKEQGKNDRNTLSETGRRPAPIAHLNPVLRGQAEGSRHGQTLSGHSQSDHHQRQVVRRGGRRHHTNPLFWLRGLRNTSQKGRASRGKGPTPAMLPTRTGPLPTRRVPVMTFWAGRIPGTLTSTGRSGRRGWTSGSHHTWSGQTRRRVSNRGCRCHRSGRARQHTSTGDTSSRQQRPNSRIPLRHGLRPQPDEVQERGRRKRDGATRNHRGRLHRRPRVAAIAGSNNSLLAILATPSRVPIPLPWLRTVRRKGRWSRDQ